MSITTKKNEKLVKKAMERGHTFKGKLVKKKRRKYFHPQSNKSRSYHLGIYEYQYKNKTYKAKDYAYVGQLKDEIDLFYVKNPKKAATRGEIGGVNVSWIKHFIVTYILVYWYITRM